MNRSQRYDACVSQDANNAIAMHGMCKDNVEHHQSTLFTTRVRVLRKGRSCELWSQVFWLTNLSCSDRIHASVSILHVHAKCCYVLLSHAIMTNVPTILRVCILDNWARVRHHASMPADPPRYSYFPTTLANPPYCKTIWATLPPVPVLDCNQRRNCRVHKYAQDHICINKN